MSTLAPLAGIRVLDLTRNVAGPFATMILGDLGAEVIKVEHPDKGDDTRHWGPPFFHDESTIFIELNRNKESIALDLSRPEARTILSRLVTWADVLVESFRPGALEKLGLGAEWAMGLNPRLIFCSVTSFGDRGPLRERPGYDPLMQAFAGLMSITGEAERPPVRTGFSVVDMGTGLWAAVATLAALQKRQSTGTGERIVTSLYETAISWARMPFSQYLGCGEIPGRFGSGTHSIVPYRAYPTADGHMVIAAGNDNLFRRLCGVLGHPEWADDVRFKTNPDRVVNRVAIDTLVQSVTEGRTRAELEQALSAQGIPNAPVRTLDQVAADEQARALGVFQHAEHGSFADLPLVGLPLSFDSARPEIRRSAPKLGEQSESILQQLGFSPAEITAIAHSGALGAR